MTECMPVFAIKTDFGYGLFQRYLSYMMQPFYLIFRMQIKNLVETEIDASIFGEYYYQKLILSDSPFDKYGFDTEKIMQNKGVEYSSVVFEFDDERVDTRYGCCCITYLGEYPLPIDVKIPRFTRSLEINYLTGKHFWTVEDELARRIVSNNGKPLVYKKMTAEIEMYPSHYGIYPRQLVEYYNFNFQLSDFNDKWVDRLIERRYQENPQIRPTKEKYNDIKFPLPTDNWRNMLSNYENEMEYLAFCDSVDRALNTFIACIDENPKMVQKPLIALLKEVNRIENETHGFGTLEAEALYDYIAKILQSLKKPRLIEKIEELREW